MTIAAEPAVFSNGPALAFCAARGHHSRNKFAMRVAFLIVLGLSCTSATRTLAAAPPAFRDATAASALTFRHIAPISPERHLHLFMGSGLAWADFDRDGVLDLFFCQGAADPRVRPGGTPAVSLWRGRSGPPSGFTESSNAAGFSGQAFANGITIGDFDGDGFADVYVTGVLTAALYCNEGDGTFTDRTADAGIVPWGFGTGCCWTDLDGDGLLDLVSARYIALDPDRYPLCSVEHQGRKVAVSCNPKRLPGSANSLYRNQGDGRFPDVSTASRFLLTPPLQSLGCVAADLDDDGRSEIYIANDTSPNELWRKASTAGIELEEQGLLSGVATNRYGASEAGMGIAVGDIDGDLRLDLYVTNYFDETNTFYRNEGDLLFLDLTEEFGLAAPSRRRLGFGTTLADFDNDGWSDLFVGNGHVQDQLPQLGRADETLAQLPQILHNRDGRRFADVSSQAGEFFRTPTVARGSAAADFDSDGLVDLAILCMNDRAGLLRNVSEPASAWLAVELVGIVSNRDAVGATVYLKANGRTWRRDRLASASYLSCDGPRLQFGIGTARSIDSLVVRWPGGRCEEFGGGPVNRSVRLLEGSGRIVPAP